MDRQLLLALLVGAIIGVGCNRSKSPPPTAAASHQEDAAAPTVSELTGAPPEKEPVVYRTTTKYDFEDDVVEGNLMRPDGRAFDQVDPKPAAPSAVAASQPPTAEPQPLAAADDAEAAQKRRQLEEIKRKA